MLLLSLRLCVTATCVTLPPATIRQLARQTLRRRRNNLSLASDIISRLLRGTQPHSSTYTTAVSLFENSKAEDRDDHQGHIIN
jgi:hypothetical protein